MDHRQFRSLAANVASIAMMLSLVIGVFGCAMAPPPGTYFEPGVVPLPPISMNVPVGGAVMALPNPAMIPTGSYEVAFNTIVDVVDDYFRIDTEQRVQMVGDLWTEGRIDTFPQGGATYFEPQRLDSIGRYNRLEATLQTIQRRAAVRVIPAEGGLLVEVMVEKDLEDVPVPEHATAGAATFRNDTFEDVNGRSDNPLQPNAAMIDLPYQSWIPIGRDIALEQQILAEITHRLGAPPVFVR